MCMSVCMCANGRVHTHMYVYALYTCTCTSIDVQLLSSDLIVKPTVGLRSQSLSLYIHVCVCSVQALSDISSRYAAGFGSFGDKRAFPYALTNDSPDAYFSNTLS